MTDKIELAGRFVAIYAAGELTVVRGTSYLFVYMRRDINLVAFFFGDKKFKYSYLLSLRRLTYNRRSKMICEICSSDNTIVYKIPT